MDTVWMRIKKGLKDGATLSLEKIDEYTKLGKLKIDELAAKRKIDRHFTDIGQVVFDLLEEERGGEVANNTSIKKAAKGIKSLREDIVRIEAEIEKVQQEARAARAERQKDETDTANA